MKKIIVSLFCWASLCNSTLWADTIILEDGEVITGKILMQNRQLRTLDLEDVLKFANEEARKLFAKAGKKDKLF